MNVDVGDKARYLIEVLNNLEGKTLAGVPCNVAVNQPRTRVVEPESDGQVPVARELRDVPTDGVLGVEATSARKR